MTNRNCFCFRYVTTQIIFDFRINKYQTNKYFSAFFWWLSLTPQLLHSVIEHGNFLNMEISQGSVATPLRCGWIFKDVFIVHVNLLMNLSVQEFEIIRNFENRLAFGKVTAKF